MNQKSRTKRVIALFVAIVMMASLIPAMVVSADGTVVFQLATDPTIQSQPLGPLERSVVEASQYLQPAGNATYTLVDNPHGEGHALQITGSTEAYYTVDVHFTKAGFNLSGGEYTIRVRASAEGGFWLAQTDDPWTNLASASVAAGFMEATHTFTVDGLGSGVRGIRISSSSDSYTIYEIVVARGTSIPAELPGAAAANGDDNGADNGEENGADDNGGDDDVTALPILDVAIPVGTQFDLGAFNYDHGWAPAWRTDGSEVDGVPISSDFTEQILAVATHLVVELSEELDGGIEFIRMGEGNNWSWSQTAVWEPGDGTTVVINLADFDSWDAIATGGSAHIGLGGLGGNENLIVRAFLVLAEEPAAPVTPVPVANGLTIVLTIGSDTALINGVSTPLDDPAFLSADGRTMVPLRFVATALGATVRWQAPLAIITHPAVGVLELEQGVQLPGNLGTTENVGGRIFVPFRFIANEFGATTAWDRDARTVTITLAAEEPVVEEPVVEEVEEEEEEAEEEVEEEAEEEAEEEEVEAEEEEEYEGLVAVPATASGYALRHEHGTRWGQAVLTHAFTDDEYTVVIIARHQSALAEFGIDPAYGAPIGHNFLEDGEIMLSTRAVSPPNVWSEHTFTFPGAMAAGGIQIAPQYPRQVGNVFYLDSVVVTNSAGEVVFSNDFSSDLSGFSIRQWSEDTQTRVPVPN